MDERSRTLVVVSHTHWDREWYLPFEAFRARLVRMMDALLDLLDRDPDYRHFVLDGQTVPLDDYLEIRPERRADIERLVRDGRLLAGPGYVLPDEFLIGGESHIRNLMTGIRSARRYGRAMMVGYAPDAFGHIAHLPAILRGFGIDSVLIWRGVGAEATTSEFRWAAPDGSEVLAVHLAHSYGMLPALPEDPETMRGALNNIRSLLEPLATTRYVLVPNGTDHLPAHTGLSNVIKRANEVLEDAEMVHGDYPSFVENVRRELGDDGFSKLPRLEGEFRSSQRSNVLAGVLSTRIWLKQRYQRCEDLLTRYAEPLSAWRHIEERGVRSQELGESERGGSARPTSASGRAGRDVVPDPGDGATRGLLRHAWRLLLQNAPHDSVTGCSVDAVYDDVAARFNRCQQIADSVIYDSQGYIADRAARPGENAVVVFNPENGPRTDFCTVRLPVEDGAFPVCLLDEDGRKTPLQVIERGGHSPLDRRERMVFGFVARDVPGFGYRAYRMLSGGQVVGARHQEQDTPTNAIADERQHVKSNGVLDASPLQHLAVENDFFRVTTDVADGTPMIEDRRTGATHRGLNRFADSGERGDEYTYCPPATDELIGEPWGTPETYVSESGPARHTLEIRMTYSLPTSLTEDRQGRSDDRVDCEIITRVSLYPGIPRIEIETEIDNRAKDHRLRVHFPTGIRADGPYAEQHFGVVSRPVGVPDHDDTWFETPVATYPQKSFVDISDGERGLMLANRGLPEYEAIEEPDGTITIALTLLRCVEWLSRDDLSTRRGNAGPSMHTPGAQVQGRWKFQYSLIPHEGGWENAHAHAHRFVRPLRAIRTSRGDGTLPASGSLIEIEPPDVILSALKLAEDGDGVVARVYNIASEPVEARVRLLLRFDQVQRVDLNEENAGAIESEDGVVRLQMRPNEITTLKFA
jgi:2-O-(6-phospho-alpha-D-mannosyl)-D-glycerate hydrolase